MALIDRILLGFLALDGLVVGVLSVGFFYTRFWGEPIPVVALVAGLLNVALLWLAARTTASPARYAPLAAWLIVFVIVALSGPGGDVVIYLDGATALASGLLLLFGLGLPVAVIASGRLPTPDTE